MIKLIVAATCTLSLSACVENAGQRFADGFEKGMSQDSLTGNTYAKGPLNIGPVDPDYPRGGVTYASSDFFHGLQVEYFSPDGKVFLWYPGNTKSVAGEWTTEGNDLCFRYQSNSYNPVTGQNGGKWECTSKNRGKMGLVSKVDGDAFGLKSGKVPAHNLKSCKLPGTMKLEAQMKCLPKA